MVKTNKKERPSTIPKIDFSQMPLYPLQRDIADDPARFKVVAIGRQAGKSFLAKWLALKYAANEGLKVWWVAPTYETARSHWLDLRRMLEGFPVRSINVASREITFWSGGTITIRSGHEPENLRGGSLDFIILDEAAFMDSSVWLQVLQPTLTATRGRALIISTPRGRNWFWNVYTMGAGNHPFYKSWTAPTTVSPYQSKEDLDVLRKSVPEVVWREEYLAEFLSDGGGVFTNVERAQVTDFEDRRKDPLETLIMGVDVGATDNYTAITIISETRGEQIAGYRFRGLSPVLQVQALLDIVSKYKPQHVNVEINGIGLPLWQLMYLAMSRMSLDTIATDDLLASYTDADRAKLQEITGGIRSNGGAVHETVNRFYHNGTRYEGVRIDNALKRVLVERTSVAIEFGRLKLLKADATEYGRVQANEISTFIRKRTLSGLEVTYMAQDGSTDDTISALMQAMHTVKLTKAGYSGAARLTNGRQGDKKRNPFSKNSRVK
jgi:hypothetical protein